MTSQVDSAAYFSQRAAEVSLTLTTRVITALQDAGLKTLSQLAFCVGQPGQLLPQTDFDNWTNSLLQNMTIGEKASLRRLILESQTMLVATLKDMTEQPDGASLKKVGMAERNARMEKLKLQLKGVAISGPLEPSHGLLDAAMQQWDSRSLKHIGPEKCHSREEEVQNLKSAASTVSLEGGKLKLVDSNSLQDLEIEGSLQVLQALRRRGVAYHFAQLISWDVHERYIDTLFKYVARPAQPGYRKVSLRQVLRADKLAFAKLAEQGEDIRADANGKLPLDIAMQSVLQEYELLVALLPLPETEGKGKKGKSKAFGRLERYEPYSPGFGKGYRNVPWKGGRGKGNAKGGKPNKGSGKAEWLPKELRYQGASAWNKRGRRVCYGFQLGQCSDPNCQKGDHNCIIFACGGDHPVTQCPMKPRHI